ncbi:MAG: sigma-54-dependent Fis family transcriptional regulator [Chromatiaceae bacterium]|nr:sigma-54-dependent Fis family transcriptional regulator [Chromatiaceae bacterium]
MGFGSDRVIAGVSAVKSEQAGIRLKSVLIVDGEADIRALLKRGLEKEFGLVETVGDIAAAEEVHERCHFDLIISAVRLPDKSGVEWLTQLRRQGSPVEVILMTAQADLDTAIAALRAGAADFILKPFRMEQMMAAVLRCMGSKRLARQKSAHEHQTDQRRDRSGLIGECQLIRNVCELIHRVAPMPSTVLIEGESGTGKELAARGIHTLSRRSGSFVPVNCGAMSPELLESELFGHVKGAFTGAQQSREGLFSYADGGTLFLDEIGEMPLSMQAHLLRVLEERRIRPVGSNRETMVNVRVVAATNRNLGIAVKAGEFREDLFFRVNVITLRMPPLREHKEDLPELVQYFVQSLAPELGIPVPEICSTDLSELMAYDWPGNVRELKNVVERCLLLNAPPAHCLAGSGSGMDKGGDPVESGSLRLEAVEKRHILNVLKINNRNKSAAARELGISRKTLDRKMQAWSAA